MIGIAGNEKSDDVLVKADLSYEEGIAINLKGKNKVVFGKQIERVIREVSEEMSLTNCSFEIEDFGALDFVIRARVKTSVKRARGSK